MVTITIRSRVNMKDIILDGANINMSPYGHGRWKDLHHNNELPIEPSNGNQLPSEPSALTDEMQWWTHEPKNRTPAVVSTLEAMLGVDAYLLARGMKASITTRENCTKHDISHSVSPNDKVANNVLSLINFRANKKIE
jgi:hypothetical protein